MKIIILDFTSGQAHVYPITPKQAEDCESFIDKKGFNSNNCQWMTSTESDFLTVHNK